MVAIGNFLHPSDKLHVVNFALRIFVQKANKPIDFIVLQTDARLLQTRLQPLRLNTAIVLRIAVFQQLQQLGFFAGHNVRIEPPEHIVPIVDGFAFFACQVPEESGDFDFVFLALEHLGEVAELGLAQGRVQTTQGLSEGVEIQRRVPDAQLHLEQEVIGRQLALLDNIAEQLQRVHGIFVDPVLPLAQVDHAVFVDVKEVEERINIWRAEANLC